MDNIDRLVSKYYYALMGFAAKRFGIGNYVTANKESIEELLHEVITNKYEHLLTDSTLDYMVYKCTIGTNLYEIAHDEYNQLNFLTLYFKHIIKDYRICGGYTFTYVDNDLKKVILKVLKRIDSLCHSDFDSLNYNIKDLERVILIVLSYYMINNRKCDIDELFNIFMNDPYQTLDSLYMNEIFDQQADFPSEYDYNLYEYVLSRIKTKNSKVIK